MSERREASPEEMRTNYIEQTGQAEKAEIEKLQAELEAARDQKGLRGMVNRYTLRGQIDYYGKELNREQIRMASSIDFWRAFRKNEAATTCFASLTDRAESLRYVEAGALKQLQGLSAEEMGAYDVDAHYTPLVQMVIDTASLLALPERKPGDILLAGSKDIIFDWNPLSAIMDSETYIPQVNLHDVTRSYILFGLGQRRQEIVIPEMSAFRGGRKISRPHTTKWGVNLMYQFISGREFSDPMGEARFVPPHVQVKVEREHSRKIS